MGCEKLDPNSLPRNHAHGGRIYCLDANRQEHPDPERLDRGVHDRTLDQRERFSLWR